MNKGYQIKDKNYGNHSFNNSWTEVPNPGGPLEWQEGVSGSSMDTQKAP